MTKLAVIQAVDRIEEFVLTANEDEVMGRLLRLHTEIREGTDNDKIAESALELALVNAFVQDK